MSDGNDWIDFLRDVQNDETLKQAFVAKMKSGVTPVKLLEWLQNDTGNGKKYTGITLSEAQRLIEGSASGKFDIAFSY